jgi:hypothetical protein
MAGVLDPADRPSPGRHPRGVGHLPPLLVRAQEILVPGHEAAGIVYGTITMGALLAAESPRSESFPETVGGAALALALVWAAHVYAAVLGHRLGGRPAATGDPPEEQRLSTPADGDEMPSILEPDPVPLTKADLRRLLRHELAVLRGGATPLLALLLSWAAGASLGTAITVTLWTCAATVVAAELLAGLRTGTAGRALALQVAVGGSLGVAVIVLKVILH